MRVVLFDIDGTLLLTGGAGLHALARAFRDLHGIENAADGIEFHGRTDPLILDSIAERRLGRGLAARELDDLLDRYLVHLADTLISQPYRVLPGVREILDGLRETGDVVMGLATGNVEPAAWEKLRRGALDGYFGFGGFGSDSADRTALTRLAVERGRERAGRDAGVVLVGDTVHDVRCAIAVGVPCLAVATGNATESALAGAGAQWTVPTLADDRVRAILGLNRSEHAFLQGAPSPRLGP
jgi:phosphoglycolate phosphatase-like HAD superfamily hydrolase